MTVKQTDALRLILKVATKPVASPDARHHMPMSKSEKLVEIARLAREALGE